MNILDQLASQVSSLLCQFGFMGTFVQAGEDQ